ncbi:MAG: PIN protein [archaeon GW2011_AR9]|nr:MAG: PIN protein [archaeon GW2011_AR9]MBS3120599.1 PIN domain-containing protein [Candidatus Woesearchaeota archaeon]HIG93013.1 type II toxin-antitoxin system VapC family toxin [Candidatus Woesearchaeota archaeon]HIH12491.1 type II toxin-antitoxin system VapC family toxin [Candidatus Woesearchaeota archaeon]
MSNLIFFFDTYALFEIFRGNSKYTSYQDVVPVTTIFNLAELNYGLKKEVDSRVADDFTAKFLSFQTEVSFDDIKNAMSFKIKHKSLSIPDVVGYMVALRLQVKFLTGDEGFRNLPQVEFVKK